MPSPFPGMNPYLEQRHQWQGFHNQFVSEFGAALLPDLPDRYYITSEEQLYLQELPDERWKPTGKPDLALSAVGGGPAAALPAHFGGEPVYLTPTVDVESQMWLQIHDRRGGAVVTAVEVASPSNKTPGPDRVQYLAKRLRHLRAGVAVVEIDLLRGGARLVTVRDCDYCAAVIGTGNAGRVWPVRLPDPLPAIPVPLAAGDDPVLVDLQAVLHSVYDRGGYRRYVYGGEPEPPLTAEQAAWAAQFVPA